MMKQKKNGKVKLIFNPDGASLQKLMEQIISTVVNGQ